jgi:energy-converting hydrogenase B subunit D
MSVVQALVLALVAGGGLVVVLVRDPFRQSFVVALYGMLLAVLFLAFQAPDVALSITAAGGVALPMMIVLALTKTRQR